MSWNKAFRIALSTVFCTSVYADSAGQVTPPPAYTQGKVSYVRTWEATAPQKNDSAFITGNLRAVKQTTQYLDGLGRPVQTVWRQASLPTGGTAADLVNATVYDVNGLEPRQYLPFAASDTGGNGLQNDGSFKLNPFQQQAAFYNSSNSQSPLAGQGETFFYGKVQYEASPFHTVEKSFSQGNSWVGSNRGTELKAWFNTSKDSVIVWRVANLTLNTTAAGFGSYHVDSSIGYYIENTLYKNVSIDENGKQVIQFTDQEGKLILKKVQLTAAADSGAGMGYSGWLCTYYIYDVMNRLRCVVQPKGVEQLAANNWQLTTDLLNEQCFRYEYDGRNRLLRKKVPGAGEVWMIYDQYDRLVMTQDARLRLNHQWNYIQYDGYNRPVATGLLTDNNHYNDQAYHVAVAKNSSNYPDLTGQTFEELTRTGYDHYAAFPSAEAGFTSAYDNSYDTHFSTSYNTAPDYAQPLVPSSMTKGLPTWTKIKILHSNPAQYEYALNIYDDKGRLIQTKSKNITGGLDIITIQHSWAGQPLLIVQKQEKAGTNAQSSVVITRMTYDDLGRITKTEKKLASTLVNNNSFSEFITTATVEYNALGQVKKKTVGNKKDPATNQYYATRQPLQEVSYDYNIRGWLLGANREFINESITADRYFGYELAYDKRKSVVDNYAADTYANEQLTGNIAGMVWKSAGDGERRKYDFGYDATNRLLKADFTQYTSSVWDTSAGVDFGMKMGDGSNPLTAYDANGNILAMQQKGLKLGGSSIIDQLTYSYEAGTNRLKQVTDAANDSSSRLGDFKYAVKTAVDYSYDADGNLVSDKNKDITAIEYNQLGLPSVIWVADKGSISYTYDADGMKLKRITIDSSVNPVRTITTLYLGGSVFQNDTLELMAHEEGRLRMVPLSSGGLGWAFDYMLRDHLGNVRMVLTEELRQDKYPVASLEDSKINTEKNYYSLDTTKIVYANTVTSLPAYTNDNGIGNNPPDASFEAANSQQLYKLNSNSNKTGLGITLNVMAGDRIDIFGKSYYTQNNTGGSTANSSVPVLDILNGLLGGSVVAAASHEAVTATQLNSLPSTTDGIQDLLDSETSDNNLDDQRPKAYINYLFFDEQFKCVGSGFSKVGSNSVLKDHYNDLQNIAVPKNGYVYIYCSNESPVDVFFDNLQVVHSKGAILEESHYYPFGLGMAGISARAAGSVENRYKYNAGTELNSFFDINLYETAFRSLDPQLGRFWQVDPLAEVTDMISPFAFANNDPIGLNDPFGLSPGDSLRVPNNGSLPGITITSHRPGWSVRGNSKGWGSGLQSGDTYTGIFTPNADQIIQMQQDAMEYVQQHSSSETSKKQNYVPETGSFIVFGDKFETAQFRKDIDRGLANEAILQKHADRLGEWGETALLTFIPLERVVGWIGKLAARSKLATRFVSTADGIVHDLKPTLDRIASGVKFPHRNDGSIFKNMEGLLPKQNAGYYREFVHPTPGVKGPGAMRIVTGEGGEMWFTPDHYKTFIPIR